MSNCLSRSAPTGLAAARRLAGLRADGPGWSRRYGMMGGMSMPPRDGRLTRRVTAALAFGAAALLAVTACTATGPASATSPGPAASTSAAAGAAADAGPIVPTRSTLHWHACTGTAGQLGVRDCTTLSVPVNYADPGGRHLSLALDMIPASAPASQQQGIMLVNPGGPGGSGLSLAAEVAGGLSPAVARDYDIVGFDPRGVGSSVPGSAASPASSPARAQTTSRPAPPPSRCSSTGPERTRLTASGRFGWLLPYMTTENVARDLDSIRAAFGVAKINYFAFSYGTYIGQVYATLFPARVRRMVLDSTVDPTGVWYSDNIGQDYAFQSRIDAFFSWVAKYDSSYRPRQPRQRRCRPPITGPAASWRPIRPTA